MANFDTSRLSPADQAAYAAWQRRLDAYVASNGGGVPAAITYALAHPDYLRQHPELQAAYNLVSGAELPTAIRTQLQDYHPVWNNGGGMAENTGAFDKWQTWLQLGLGAGLGGTAAAGLLGGGAGAAGGGGTLAAENVAPFAGLPGGISATEGGAGLAGTAGGASALPAHLGGTGPGVPSGGGGAGAGGILDTILKYAPVGAGLVQHFASGNGPGGDAGQAGQVPPELSELLKTSMDRMRAQEPLFQAVTKQALAGLPTYAQGK